MTARYDVVISGCDGSTHVLDVELTDAEHAAVARVAQLATELGGGCQPTMRVEDAPAGPPSGASCDSCWEDIGDRPYVRSSSEYWRHQACAVSS